MRSRRFLEIRMFEASFDENLNVLHDKVDKGRSCSSISDLGFVLLSFCQTAS